MVNYSPGILVLDMSILDPVVLVLGGMTRLYRTLPGSQPLELRSVSTNSSANLSQKRSTVHSYKGFVQNNTMKPGGPQQKSRPLD